MEIVAILSTTVLPLDGLYCVRTVEGAERQEVISRLVGVPHYVGHPDTKMLLESLGAIPAPTKLFEGLGVGQAAICVPIKQGLSSRITDGFTVNQAISEMETLDVRVLVRIE